ncbi:exodeoxyribonuclease VII large subunit [Akkermansiaceae bacterium]|nr:exodeoxyribonuclease VII large subunit [Akkermansiaceae bacterium]MDB4544423.1 exodeoxyribonuclease VII large subunit [Akkermansiaceae bacterium]
MSEVKAISVTQLARRIRNLLEIQVGEIWVEGEVSNVRKQSSGHWYFSLKDESAQISCAMFSARRRSGHEVIEDGVKVQIFGETSFYEARGSTQLIVKKAQAVGQGDLQARFEALKKKLNEEGLFDQSLKKKLPGFPKVIGIVTSPTGAALQDMKNVLTRRAPWLTVVLFPAAVQGKGAERGIARAIKRAGNADSEGLPQPEVLIVGRGGGSLEDLWNFNEEIVARAIAECPIPVVSAVGHEIDFTICDFVADLRAPTPSAAAELVAPDQEELRNRLDRMGERLTRSVESRLDRLADQLDFYERGILGQSPDRVLRSPIQQFEESKYSFIQAAKGSLAELENSILRHSANWHRYHPREVLRRRQQRIDATQEAFLHAAENSLRLCEEKVTRLDSVLQALGPSSILERGFSITFDQDGEIVKGPGELKSGDRLETMLRDGNISSRME